MRTFHLATLVVVLAACGSPQESAQRAAEPSGALERTPLALTSMQQDGRLIFESLCWTCHGPAGRGDGPVVRSGSVPAPPSFLAEEYARASTESLQSRFEAGLDGMDASHPHMQYVASILKPESFEAALSYIPALAYPPELPGSTLAGQSLYGDRCVGCHGEFGRGDGTAAASLVVMQPADFTTDTLLATRDWNAVFEHIKEGGRQLHGSSMPPWGIVLSEAEMWDLVAYLGTFQSGLLSDPPWSE